MTTSTLPALRTNEIALLVLDCQPVVLQYLPDSDSLVVRINQAIATVRTHGGHVGFVRVALTDDDYRAVPLTNHRFTRVAESRSLTEGEPAVALHSDIDARPDDIEVRKVRTSAFSTTDLDAQLTNLGVTTIVLAGVSTSGVVLSTVRDAADRDYRIIVLSDCTADSDPELHRVLMERVLPHHADIATIAEIGAAFGEEVEAVGGS